MGTRDRKSKRYKSGDCTLGWFDGFAIANFTNPSTGKRQRVRLKRCRKGSQEARDALDQFAERRRAVQKHEEILTVGRLWERWLADRKEDGFRNDIYEAQWVALGPVFGNRTPHLLETNDYRKYAKARFAAGLSQWTVHNDLRRMRACLKWAHEQGLVAKLPKVWVPQAGKHRGRTLTFDEARQLVLAARAGDPHIYVFVVLAFATGARHAAILDLTWDRVDFVSGLIQFDVDAKRDPMSKAWSKGRATVVMNRSARAALEQAHRGSQTDHVIEHGGRRLKTVRAGFANAVKRAGIDQSKGKVTPHTIRHTVLTWLDEGEIETKRAAQLAGHSDERTTRLVYTHASPEMLRDAVELLDDVFTARQVLEGAAE